MRHTAGQSADRLHLLRLPQLGFRLSKGLLRPGPLDELADLQSDIGRHLEQFLIGLPHLPAVEFDDDLDTAADANGESECAVQTDGPGRHGARKIGVGLYVRDPRRVAGGPDPAWEPHTTHECLQGGGRHELVGPQGR